MQEKIASSLVEATAPVIRAPPKFEMATASHDAINTSVEIIMKERKTRRLTPDSAAPNPVNGKSHSRQTEMDHPI